MGKKRGGNLTTLSKGHNLYPVGLSERLGAGAPDALTVAGNIEVLNGPLAAFLCSRRAPGASILKAFDQAAEWRDTGRCVISGFHSELEQQCFDILLRGDQPIVLAKACGFSALRLPPPQRKAFDEGRLIILSGAPVFKKRVDAKLAYERNRIIAALSEEIVFGYVSYGSALSKIEFESRNWGIPRRTLHA